MKLTSQNEVDPNIEKNRAKLFKLFEDRPMTDEELLVNLGLYMRSGALAKILFMDEMYKKIKKIPGNIMEFGVWFGQTLSVLENLRAVHEPYNHQRRVVGFDTFEGYLEVGDKDKSSELIKKGGYKVRKGYEAYLEEVLDYHENENVMRHVKKHQVIKGDVTTTLPSWLSSNPQAFVALAFFDMALYEPTRNALLAIQSRLVKGSVIVFDELNHPDYPGETEAALEVLGKEGFAIENSEILPDRVFFTKL